MNKVIKVLTSRIEEEDGRPCWTARVDGTRILRIGRDKEAVAKLAATAYLQANGIAEFQFTDIATAEKS